MAASDYTVKISLRDGLLEVIGPDREWVDAKIEQLQPVLAGAAPTEDAPPDTKTAPKRAAKRTRTAKREAPTEPGAAAPTAPRRARSTGGRSEMNAELRDLLTPDVKREFKQYIDERRKKWDASQNAQAAIIATFLHDKLGVAGVDQHDLYTAYTVMGERSPANIRSQLTNARQRARYFSVYSEGKAVLSHAGENFARFDSVDGADGDGE